MKIDLKNQKCQACTGDTPKFDEKQIIKYLSKFFKKCFFQDVFQEYLFLFFSYVKYYN